jgi:hypothetical protein
VQRPMNPPHGLTILASGDASYMQQVFEGLVSDGRDGFHITHRPNRELRLSSPWGNVRGVRRFAKHPENGVSVKI